MMAAKLLIAEDDHELAELLQYNFECENYAVDVVHDGPAAETMCCKIAPDLIVLDWGLPHLSGIEVCRRLRANPKTRRIPIIMLTARSEERDIVSCLGVGADDYVVKPFSVKLLLARIAAVLRRANECTNGDLLALGDIVLNLNNRTVKRGRQHITLKPTEFRLLKFLMERPGRVLTRAQIVSGVWGNDNAVEDRSVDVHISRLRHLLDRKLSPNWIHSVKGIGYMLNRTPPPVRGRG